MDTTSHATGVRRLVRRAAAAALALCVSTVFAVFAVAGPAHARCAGGTPITMALPLNASNTWGEERAVSGTCNGNDHYTGRLYDTSNDGYDVCLEIYDDTNGPFYRAVCVGDNQPSEQFEQHDDDGYLYFVLYARNQSVGRYFTGF